MSPQYVLCHAASRIQPQQWGFYGVIEPDFLWNFLVSVCVPSGFKGLLALKHSKKYLGGNCDDSPWLYERMEISKGESVVCPFIYHLAYISCCLKQDLFWVPNKLLFCFLPPSTEMSYCVQVPSPQGAWKERQWSSWIGPAIKKAVLKPNAGWSSHFVFPLSSDYQVTVTGSSVDYPQSAKDLFVIVLGGIGKGGRKLKNTDLGNIWKYYDWSIHIFRKWSFVHLFLILLSITSDFWQTKVNNQCGLWKKNIKNL